MFGGALSGEDTKAKKQRDAPATPEKPVGIRYRRALFGVGVQQAITDTVVLYDEADSQLQREWLRFDLIRPSQQTRTIERNTFLKNGPGDRTGVPAEFRRYSIAISAGSLKPEVVAQFAKALGKQLKISDWRKQLDALSREPVSPDLAQRLSRLENSVAMLSGHIAAFSLNAEVSELTRHIAFGNALTYAQVIPSITIISLEGDRKTNYELGADLRLDEVEAWPYPGAPGRVVELFQSARGIQGTMLEGYYVEKLTGKKGGANALSLLSATDEGPERWLVFKPGQKERLSQIAALPPTVRRLLEATLDNGREIIITSRPVELAGRQRFGWWERDRASGRMIGVLDDGRHGMTEYTLETKKIGLNENMGYVVGAIVGAVTTEALLAAEVLEQGAITEKVIAEIEKMMERLQCLSCPKAERKLQAEGKPTLACLEIDNVTKFSAGPSASAKMDFCENYVKGLKCATSLLLDGYKSKPTGLGSYEFSLKQEYKIGCQDLLPPPKRPGTGQW